MHMSGRDATQYNDTKLNYIRLKDTQHNGTNKTQHKDIQHNDN